MTEQHFTLGRMGWFKEEHDDFTKEAKVDKYVELTEMMAGFVIDDAQGICEGTDNNMTKLSSLVKLLRTNHSVYFDLARTIRGRN